MSAYSRFFSDRHALLEAYTPGEQPRDMAYIKLNTNESPYPPSPGVAAAVAREAGRLQLYSDPTCRDLNAKAAHVLGVGEDQILMTNGSDEILNFIFMAFGDSRHPFAFPTLTYGFYPVFARLNNIPYREIPMGADLSIDPADYRGLGMHIVIANPNAPTGLYLDVSQIEQIVATNRDSVVVVDEAYIDFGGESCLPLLKAYDNLLITRTFSKSYSLAGARLGFGIGHPSLIADLNTIKYSTNPYNINRMTMAAGIAALEENDYYREKCRLVAGERERTKAALRGLGFTVTDSAANFLFAAHPELDGEELYLALRRRGILVRHFSTPAIRNYNRITVGTATQMDALLDAVKDYMKEVSVL